VDLAASEAVVEEDLPCDDLLILDQALEKLSRKDEMKGNVVKLRYFAGLTIDQTACSLGISPATAKRSWTYARAWLIREMGGSTEQRSC
jgi:RNA polymerase sigma factor (sigma-70 family)